MSKVVQPVIMSAIVPVFFYIWTAIMLVVAMLNPGEGAPLPWDQGPDLEANVKDYFSGLTDNPTKKDKMKKESFDYLVKYGHAHDPKNMKFKDFKVLLKKFQKYVHIQETGESDDLTIETMRMPRCGLPDVVDPDPSGRKKRFSTRSFKWTNQHFTYKISIHTGDVSLAVQRQAFVTAFKKWSDQTTLTFTPTTCSNVKIDIRFVSGCHGDGSCFDGPSGVLAHAYYPSTGSLGGDVHMDNDERWTVAPGLNINMVSVAIHEIGHSLGLRHSDVTGAIMQPIYARQLKLGVDDIAGIQSLYGNSSTDYAPGDRPISEACVDRSTGYPQVQKTTASTPTTPTTTTPTTTTPTKATPTPSTTTTTPTTTPTTTTASPATTTTTPTTTTTTPTTTTTTPTSTTTTAATTTTMPTTTTTTPTTVTTTPTTATTTPTTTTTTPTTTTTTPTTTTTSATTTTTTPTTTTTTPTTTPRATWPRICCWFWIFCFFC